MNSKIRAWLNRVRQDKTFSLPTPEELYANPVEKIEIPITWYDVDGMMREFMRQVCSGYLWEVKFGHSFIAAHREEAEVRRILDRLEFFEARMNRNEWWPRQEEEFQLLLVDFARVLPHMWD